MSRATGEFALTRVCSNKRGLATAFFFDAMEIKSSLDTEK
jgi:hypothetical protein